MYSVILVEDEANILNHMKNRIASFDEFSLKGAYLKPEDALEAFSSILPDVVFLDIEMPRMNGLELAGKMLARKNNLKIIFTTAYEQYALNAFDVEAIDYLLKPVMKDDIQRVVKRLNKAMSLPDLQGDFEKDGEAFPVSCFGRFEARDKSGCLVKWPTKKAEEVFACFVTRQGQYISNWELLELFWGDIKEERSLPNLYNTVYRIKGAIKNLACTPQIQKMNEGYVLEAKGELSDLACFLKLAAQLLDGKEAALSLDTARRLFFTYTTPLFGARDYLWCLPLEKHLGMSFGKLCRFLLDSYGKQGRLEECEEVIRHYASQHIEDEELLRDWLVLLRAQTGQGEKAEAYRRFFNEKLREADLPLL